MNNLTTQTINTRDQQLIFTKQPRKTDESHQNYEFDQGLSKNPENSGKWYNYNKSNSIN